VARNPVDYVDPRIATHGAGNCLIGPYLPNSLVRLGPDTIRPQPTSGYNYTKPIWRFSHTHVSGTGGASRFGNIGVIPFLGHPRFEVGPYTADDEQAAAGYYAVTLREAGIRVELTSTPRTGMHRYVFAEAETGDDGAVAPDKRANILIDIGAVLQRDFRVPVAATGGSIGGFGEWISDTELVGRGDFQGGWGHDFPYSVYFYARFDRPVDERYIGNNTGIGNRTFSSGANCRAVAAFRSAREVGLRVGVSFVSVANARAGVEREAVEEFPAVRNRARATWNESLSRIHTEGGTEAQRRMFYTFFTRLICMPTDLGVDDEFPLWKSGVRHFSEYYCLWDSVRDANSLISLFDPGLEADMLSCLLDVAEHIGWLPDAWIAGHSAAIQGGSSADILFCEAKLKGLTGIDYEKALTYMRKNAEVESPDPYLYGRYLPDWRDLGYLSTNVKRNAVARHLEYAYQDWCIGKLAEQLGTSDVAARYFESSRKVWNLWKESLRLFAPKHPDGSWVEPFDPDQIRRPDSWNDPYFMEARSWNWSWNVQHDFAGHVARMGGAEAYVARLDEYFDSGRHGSKEIMLHVPYLYLYAGRPDRATERVRQCLDRYFFPERRGLVDNEDMGCQSAFYMASSMGLYPLMGQDLYWLVAPSFDRVVVRLGSSGATLTIEAPGASGEFSAPRYIVGATLDGKPLDRPWLRHAEIAGGATLELEIDEKPGEWGRGSVPPSPLG
jgi:predicted alpha-1,2-mannosidase